MSKTQTISEEAPLEESQQVLSNITKNDSETKTLVASIQRKKICCHSCSPAKEIGETEFSYKFEMGYTAYFCSQEELDRFLKNTNRQPQ